MKEEFGWVLFGAILCSVWVGGSFGKERRGTGLLLAIASFFVYFYVSIELSTRLLGENQRFEI